MALLVKWEDRHREPREKPDPDYPEGIDVDISEGAEVFCWTRLAYPAKRCGTYHIYCNTCGVSVGVTTAGRPDDPKSVRIACGAMRGTRGMWGDTSR